MVGVRLSAPFVKQTQKTKKQTKKKTNKKTTNNKKQKNKQGMSYQMWWRGVVGVRLSAPFVKGNLWPLHWQIVFKPTHNTADSIHTAHQNNTQHTLALPSLHWQIVFKPTHIGTLADALAHRHNGR